MSCSPVSSNVLSSQRSVCTQLCFVWLFSTVVTTSLRVLDCDQGLEGRLIMDPTLACPLANPAKQPDANPAPAVLGITMLVIYGLGILAFLSVAIKFAFSSAKKRFIKEYAIKKIEFRSKKRKKKQKKREKVLSRKVKDVEEFGKKVAKEEGLTKEEGLKSKAAIDKRFRKDQKKRKVCCPLLVQPLLLIM